MSVPTGVPGGVGDDQGPSSAPGRVLVVEDDPPISRLVVTYLEQEGFTVDAAADGETGVELARSRRPDVIVLDLMLPGMDGIEVCRRIRTFSEAYIIMLTARTEEIDRLIGLSVGADDYLGKPFSPRELVARVKAMLRRPRSTDPEGQPPRGFGALQVDPVAREVRLGGQLVALTRIEFDLLNTLSAHPRTAFARRRLLEEVWGGDWFRDDHVVEVHVANLRRKLDDDPQSPRFIRTVRGVGYRMGAG
ncbi:response regulator transcription factor [soil metagenome]